MNWRRTLQAKTRQPEFLWQMVIVILIAGIGAGFLVQDYRHRLPFEPFQVVVNPLPPEGNPDRLAAQGRWLDAWRAIPMALMWRTEKLGLVALAVLAGCCWLVFVIHALQVRGIFDPRLWLALAAVPLGVWSIWPTHFFRLWQEQTWGLEEGASLLYGLRYYIFGVGLREETAKLLCLLPLMPLLLRLRSELAALLVSGSAGIGFALAENAGYFAGSGGTDAMGRYLTANPFHMTLTALVGLALYRGLRSPRDWGLHAAATFLLMVFAHGLYDAFIVLPALAEYSLLGTITFVLVVYQFFRELRDARAKRPDTVSLTANFLCGVSLVTAATFICLSSTAGCAIAFNVLADDVLGLAVMVYLFLREMPETMVRV